MYQYSIFNSGIETIIHVPVPDKDAPHILSAPFKESLSQAEQLTLIIPYNNPGYNLIEGMNTKVKVYDTRDNSVIFTGRVTPIKDGLNSDGGFPKEVTCEGAMSYLIDSNTRRWEFVNQTPTQILTYLLNQHNSKMDNERKIYLGTVQINQPITINTNFESTLNAIVSKIKNILGGDLRVQERNGLLYLDYLADQGTNNGAKVELRRNLKELIREYDPRDVISRGIPMGYGEGINQLDITSVNNGVEYIEDTGAIAKYGVIEDLITNKDIQNADTLLIYGRTVLAEKSQPRLTYQQTALDLSVLPGHQNERYALGDTLNTIVDVMSIDVLSRIIERERDLILNPWNPKLTISTRPIRLSDQTVDLKQRSQSLENAPQGSTYIDTFGYAESIDANHAFQLPIWLSPDILNVNRVRLHIDAQKYRAYEKGMGSSGYSKKTSGPSSTSTSGSSSSTTTGSSSKATSPVDKWGPFKSIGNPTQPTTGAENIFALDPRSDGFISDGYYTETGSSGSLTMAVAKAVVTVSGTDTYYAWVDMYRMQHQHNFDHYHNMGHTHEMGHYHGMEHNHNMEHTHEMEIDAHEHPLQYGIFEDTFPKGVYVKINGQTVSGPLESIDYDGVAQAFSVDLDLTPYVGRPGDTYNLEITSAQNGRINAWVSVQAFIQAK